LDCGLLVQLEIRDGVILMAEPQGIVGYVAVPFYEWYKDLGYA